MSFGSKVIPDIISFSRNKLCTPPFFIVLEHVLMKSYDVNTPKAVFIQGVTMSRSRAELVTSLHCLQLLLMLQPVWDTLVFVYLLVFLRTSPLHFRKSRIEEATGGSFASTFLPLAVERKCRGQQRGVSERQGCAPGQRASLAADLGLDNGNG